MTIADRELRMTIIGLGNLLEALFPIISRAIPAERRAIQLNATTADVATVDPKQQRLGIPVFAFGSLEALESLQPHVIWFAPPPSEARGLVRDVLAPYYAAVRRRGDPLPLLCVFPPVPQGRFYRGALGEDAPVVHLLTSATNIAKADRGEDGTCACTYERALPAASAALLGRLVHPLRLVPVDASHVMANLSAGVMYIVLGAALLELAAGSGGPTETAHQALAGALGGGGRPGGGEHALASRLVEGWRVAVMRFLVSHGIEDGAARQHVASGVDGALGLAARETRSELVRLARHAATPGGMTERAMSLFADELKPMIRGAAGALPSLPESPWERLSMAVVRLAEAVHVHGSGMAGEARDAGTGPAA